VFNIVIIGAGLSGLSAGAKLIRDGFTVIILEKSNSVGGLAGSFTKDNYKFDFGPHIFFGKKIIPELRKYFNVEDILLKNDNLKQAIYIKNDVFKYPFQLKEVLRKMGKKKLPLVFRDILLESIRSRRNRQGGEQSLEEWVKRKIGRTLFDYIELDTYVNKLYGISASEISSDWGKQRLKPLVNMNLWKSLNRNFNPFVREKRAHTLYCPKGIGDIAIHLTDYIVKNGGSILTDSIVENIKVVNNRVMNIGIRENGKLKSVSADFFISSLKITDLIDMIEPKPDDMVLDSGKNLRYRNLIIVYLIVNKSKVLNHCLMYCSLKKTIFKRITDFRHFSGELMPDNETILAVEICTNLKHEIWNYEDKKIFEKLINQLEGIGIINRKDVLHYFTIRIPRVYPVYFLNYGEHLKVILDYLKKIENLVSIGRGGLYQHDNMPTAMASGFTVAELIKQHSGNDIGEVSKTIYGDRLNKYKNKV
jgi:protoporphyrinogen oxidase